jgi:hypothetical protein
LCVYLQQNKKGRRPKVKSVTLKHEEWRHFFFFVSERTVRSIKGLCNDKWKATLPNSEDTVRLAMVGMATGLLTVQTRCSRVLQWLHHGEQCALWGRLR